MKNKHKFAKATVLGIVVLTVLLCGPAASWLQMSALRIDPSEHPDALYLVCGARAQNNRITTLVNWVNKQTAIDRKQQSGVAHDAPVILIGNDPQKNCWCRTHQTNHTVTAWALEKLGAKLPVDTASNLTVVPGSFSTTDGEMAALSEYLLKHPQIKTIALVTSGYHSRRAVLALRRHAPSHINIRIVSGSSSWHNRNPLTVAIELLKILRDSLGLSHAPIISRENT